jgi:hypothetical protein
MRYSGARREITKIRKILNETCGLNYLSVKDANFMLDKICEALVVDEKSNGWIPVSERLPEASGTYQVTCMDGRIYHSTYAKFQSKLKRWELTGARSYWKVTAWMPLPEPYKED